jgi:hypothetical protein
MKTLSLLKLHTVSCDSGNLVIIDPCYLKNSDNVDSLIDCGLATSINTEIGIMSVSVFAGQLYVGNGYRQLSNSIDQIKIILLEQK